PRVEGVPEEGEADTEHQAKAEAEHAVAERARADLRPADCATDEHRIGCLQREQRLELVGLRLELACLNAGARVALCAQLNHSLPEIIQGLPDRPRVQLLVVERELPRDR